MITTLGFLGEFLKIISFAFKGRKNILLVQLIASIVLALFWILSEQIALGFLTFLNIFINLHAQKINEQFYRQTYMIYYLVIPLSYYFFNDTNYHFMLLFLLVTYARSLKTEKNMRKAFLLAQILFIGSNIITFYPSLLFSTSFSFIVNLYRYFNES